MTNNFKKAVIALFCLLYFTNIFGQGRIVSLDYITGKFTEYCNAVPREEIYIHTDRDDYIAGEEMWFNVYVVDRKSSKPSPYSRIVYVELMNRYNNPVLQKRILISDGSGPGQVVLPDSLSSGNYTLRAYTDWMRNFLPVNCYMKDLNIYNTFSSSAFKVKPGFSDPAHQEQPLRRRRLSLISDSSFKMETTRTNSGDLEISLRTNDEFRSLFGNVYYLIIQTHGIINYKNTVRISRDDTGLTIPGKDIIHGINHITLFESTGEPIFEKYIYTPDQNNRYLTLNSTGEYDTRHKISLNINTITGTIQPSDIVDLSVSVVPDEVSINSGDIDSYMVFGTEFGIIPDGIKNMDIDDIPPDVLNRYLSTLKSNWIDWNSILFEEIPSFSYGFEKEYHFITGSLINRKTLAGNPGEFIFLSTPSKNASLQYSITDTTGRFVFVIPVTNEISDLIIQPEKVIGDNTVRMESSFSELVYPFNGSTITERVTPEYVSDLAAHYQVAKIYGTSYVGDAVKQDCKLPEAKRFYGKPDIELLMSDYITLPVMQEVFFELLPGIAMRKRKSEYEISIYDFVENKTYNKPPGLFIDGVLVSDAALIAELDPELVEKIDVVKDAYFIGEYFFYGIISLITHAGDFSNVQLPDHTIRIPYRVTEPVYSLLNPDYSLQETKQSRVPDFRNTLYWNPSLKPDSQENLSLEFWTSDLPGDYVINIQGITAKGEKISLKKTLKIGQEHLAGKP